MKFSAFMCFVHIFAMFFALQFMSIALDLSTD